jgi:catechol 2,3-dioxygenase-like lactoylglutathione lyase family enzyme
MITHISLTTVYVSDQQKALDFYTNKLGFEVRADDTMGDMRWIQVAPQGAQTSIVLAQGDGGTTEKLGLEADDIEATYRKLAGRGVTFTETPNKQPWGIQAQFVDQDGNGYVLVQHG